MSTCIILCDETRQISYRLPPNASHTQQPSHWSLTQSIPPILTGQSSSQSPTLAYRQTTWYMVSIQSTGIHPLDTINPLQRLLRTSESSGYSRSLVHCYSCRYSCSPNVRREHPTQQPYRMSTPSLPFWMMHVEYGVILRLLPYTITLTPFMRCAARPQQVSISEYWKCMY